MPEGIFGAAGIENLLWTGSDLPAVFARKIVNGNVLPAIDALKGISNKTLAPITSPIIELPLGLPNEELTK